MNSTNHQAQTQSRIASIILEVIISELGGSHQPGDVEAKVNLYNGIYAKCQMEDLLTDAEPYLKVLRGAFLSHD